MKRLFLLALSLLLLTSGCASRYMIDQPYVISPCLVTDPALVQDYATASLLLSLQERKWTVNKVDKDQHRVVAEACRHGQNCVSVESRILADGTIHAFRQRQPKFDEIETLQKWMGGLDKNYKSRCLTSYEVILNQLQRRGIDYANIKSATVPAATVLERGDTEE